MKFKRVSVNKIIFGIIYRTPLLKNKLPDKLYLILQYRSAFNKSPNLKKPLTFNEKLLWLKLYWRKELAYDVVDKYKVREYVKDKGLSEHLVRLYGVYDSFDEIDFDKLPPKFVIKNTGDSGGVKVINNNLDINSLREYFYNKRKNTFANYAREWVYSKSKNRIIIEELINTSDGHAPKDYKFFCFYGEPKFLFVGSERDKDVKFDFFDIEWNHIPVHQGHEWATYAPNKPEKFDEMLNACRVLSADFPEVRVDLYYENDKIFFGELTFFHFGGIVPFMPNKYDTLFGDYFDLSMIPEDEIYENKN